MKSRQKILQNIILIAVLVFFQFSPCIVDFASANEDSIKSKGEIVYNGISDNWATSDIRINLNVTLIQWTNESGCFYKIDVKASLERYDEVSRPIEWFSLSFSWDYNNRIVCYFMEYNITAKLGETENFLIDYNFETPIEISSFQWNIDFGSFSLSDYYHKDIQANTQYSLISFENLNHFAYDIELRTNESVHLIQNHVYWPNTSSNVIFGEWTVKIISNSTPRDSLLEGTNLQLWNSIYKIYSETGSAGHTSPHSIGDLTNCSDSGIWIFPFNVNNDEMELNKDIWKNGDLKFFLDFVLDINNQTSRIFRYDFQETPQKGFQEDNPILFGALIGIVGGFGIGVITVSLFKKIKNRTKR
ncbi:hypothetical protein NEF87_004374 [Candidatus Lokiarchaeum ossiferum]|uniref:Uncharacterized protein n=1 Tax=Candidatus Lokiarchaeum ossiferum TaxID=2951803 RepID=A0ABY6I057_9ARCH|nr:hypothetical protein NEF87_004374 [Candidatus Lokiarchaeum sp. B-35]